MTIPHGGERGHDNPCPTCGATFTTEALLETHKKLHAADPEQRERLEQEQSERRP